MEPLFVWDHTMPNYRFSVRETTSRRACPIGFAVNVDAATPEAALEILRDTLPEYALVDADDPSVSTIRVYFYPDDLTVDDVEEIEEE